MYLSSSPQITLWQVVYRRHTNFSMESIELNFQGTVDFGRKATCLIARNGDLIWHAYLSIELPSISTQAGKSIRWVREIGHFIIDEISTEIGGAIIDRQYGQWLSIYNELTQTAEKQDAYRVMIGDTTALADDVNPSSVSIAGTTIYVPLRFWWNKNPGLALPLIALMYHDVKVNVQFRPLADLYITTAGGTLTETPHLGTVSLFVDYIFLDAAERKMFSQQSHEYLIEQVQFLGGEAFSQRQKLNFSHPCKELIWVVQKNDNATNKLWSDFTDSGSHTFGKAKIQLNTHDRISARAPAYYNLIQPYYHHTRVPRTGIYSYSFAVNPEEHQPSGSINMSRIEGTTLVFEDIVASPTNYTIYTYAVNYNVLRITSGMGGTAFAS